MYVLNKILVMDLLLYLLQLVLYQKSFSLNVDPDRKQECRKTLTITFFLKTWTITDSVVESLLWSAANINMTLNKHNIFDWHTWTSTSSLDIYCRWPRSIDCNFFFYNLRKCLHSYFGDIFSLYKAEKLIYEFGTASKTKSKEMWSFVKTSAKYFNKTCWVLNSHSWSLQVIKKGQWTFYLTFF